jgi:hypothetical protein
MSSTTVPFTSCSITSNFSCYILATGYGPVWGSTDDIVWVYSGSAGDWWSEIVHWTSIYDIRITSCASNASGYFSILFHTPVVDWMQSKRATYAELGTPYWDTYFISDGGSPYNLSACMDEGVEPLHGGAWCSGMTMIDDSYFGWAGVFPYFILDLTYVSGSPVPSSGGNIYFDVYLENASGQTQDFDAWLDIEYMGFPTTIVQRSFTNYLSGWAINRPDMYYYIPSTYSSGFYTMYGRAGDNPYEIWAEDSFSFMKMGNNQDSTFIPWIPDNLPDYFGEVDGRRELPIEYLLTSISPNPFNPITVISYRLPDAGFVNLVVYTIAGRQVTELVNGWRETGVHEVTFNGSNLASGIYVYTLIAGNIKASDKMLLIK